MPSHGAGAGLTHATAWYFRTVEEAQAFVTKFPMLVLADGTELPTYQSPNLPFGRGAEWSDPVCNLYSMLKSQEAMRRLFDGLVDRAGNMPPLPGIYPDYSAPIIRNGAEGRELVMARWGMPTPPQYLAGKKVDRGVTNIRQTTSSHWRAWLGPEHRCLVPFTSFAENETLPDGSRPPVWFAFDESRPLAFFAGIWATWTSVRKVKEGPVRADLFGFLTSAPNAEVARGPSQGDAGDPDRSPGVGDLAHSTLGGGEGAATSTAGRFAPHRRAGRERGCAAGLAAGECMERGAGRTAPRTASVA